MTPELSAMLEELDGLSADATPGPWFADGQYVCIESVPGPNDEPEHLLQIFQASVQDAELAAALRNAYPAISAALRSAGGREGCVMVPVEPTEEMIQAAIHCLDGVNLKAIPGNATHADIKRYKPLARYRAMLAARGKEGK